MNPHVKEFLDFYSVSGLPQIREQLQKDIIELIEKLQPTDKEIKNKADNEWNDANLLEEETVIIYGFDDMKKCVEWIYNELLTKLKEK